MLYKINEKSIIKISGGLGNQLFQFSFGYFLESKMKIKVAYDVGVIQDSKEFTNRQLDIEKFNIHLPFATEEEIAEKKKLHQKLWRIERKLVFLFPWFNKKMRVQNNPHDDVEIGESIYYDGYWQNYKYPEAILDFLRKKIVFNKEQELRHNVLISKIQNSVSVSVHIRRSDYLTIPVNAKIFNVCEKGYYDKGFSYIKSKYPDAVFFIFTQDIEWAKENISEDNCHFVEGNTAIEDMILMSRCKHNIIANSTFSWWSAFLNSNEEKVVIAPEKWYKNELNNTISTIIPLKWIRL
ncbi:alpha-1,2-fucosyltransferase [Empedobacter sp.]|uniref:alpha-1,2-fucosyltransferase n=1 Tax=Empedobacter sp. TaxID=1927715 RepID=UPI0028AED48A|nr:alpha-1,2-fucosyltransferase [Empedobacter sp.]